MAAPPTDTDTPPSLLALIDAVTVGSFLLVAALLFLAYALSVFALPPRTSTKLRVIFIWHLFDGLIHFVFEGSFLYYSFTARAATGLAGPSSHVLWGDSAVAYGARHSQAPLARLWQEYAKADLRWGESDICVVALELLTVGVGGPLALWICDMVRREDQRMWFWVTVLATGELYGGFMTFVPEWLTGSHNLETGNFMYKWVHLFFFNTIWVWIPLWLLYEAYNTFLPALQLQAMVSTVSGTASALGGATFGAAGSSSDEDSEDEGKKAR
ncbi:Emopamil binding protein-domain-containing protein [Morchella snyderi]|nr:Emopamil binding protein-domain-containing protein [Morchella snyderi]